MIWIALGIMIAAWTCLIAARVIKLHTSLIKHKRRHMRVQRRRICNGLRYTGLSLCLASLVLFLIFEFSSNQI